VRKFIFTGILLASFALITTAAFACGDKLMLNFGSLQFRQVYARHPASVLAYVRQNSPVAGVVRQLELQPVLKQSGHKFYAVNGPAGFEEALKTGKYDLVLADAADAESLEHELEGAPLMPSVLPVVYKSTRVEAASVEKKFRAILKAPGSVEYYLAAIDQAMEVRVKGASSRVAR
jgi:hypothetical protein